MLKRDKYTLEGDNYYIEIDEDGDLEIEHRPDGAEGFDWICIDNGHLADLRDLLIDYLNNES